MDPLNPADFTPQAMKALLESAKSSSLQMQYQQQLAQQLQTQQILQSLQAAQGIMSPSHLSALGSSSSSSSGVNMKGSGSSSGLPSMNMMNQQNLRDEPYLAALNQIQNAFATGSAPSMVIAPTHIPLYPGYAQVPAGPGYVAAPGSKYNQLLAVIEEMGKDLRPSYSGSKMSAERFKRGIAQARILLREAMTETNSSGDNRTSSSVSK